MTEKVQVVVIGAGLAGLSAAYHLAEAGIETVVVERGNYPGSKNVTGGRLYLNPVRPYFPAGFWDDAPFERAVVKEKLSIMAEHASTTIEVTSAQWQTKPYPSHTLLRAHFDQWLADKVRDKGALIVPKSHVDDLIYDGSQVVGIKSTEAELSCDVVIAADGVLSMTAGKAKLRDALDPQEYALGIKETIELPAKTIEDRFGVAGHEGAAQLFFGSITQGLVGGGFLYTNRESVSLGMVVGIGSLLKHVPDGGVPELLAALKARPEVAPLIRDGYPLEYAAHVIPESVVHPSRHCFEEGFFLAGEGTAETAGMIPVSGIYAVPKFSDNGILVVGDAAGFALNMGVTMRGMDFALVSGALAARAVTQAKSKNDFTAKTLSVYDQLLRDSFILKDINTFSKMPQLLENPRLLNQYPAVIVRILENLFWIDEEPRKKLASTTFREALKGFGNWDALRDLLLLLQV